MTRPVQRRRDPEPVSHGWELAVVLCGGVAIAVVLAALAGLGLAASWWGEGWVWPRGTETITRVVAGLLHGEPGRGLPPDQQAQIAGPLSTYVCIAVSESVLLATCVTCGVVAARYRRPDARGGMASRIEAKQALGLRHLRAAAPIIRPDLHGPNSGKRRRRAPADEQLSTAETAVLTASSDGVSDPSVRAPP